MKTDPHIAIIIVNWNGKEDLLPCISSLCSLTYPYYEIIVVDNASNDDSIVVLSKVFPSIPILRMNQNVGFAEGNNQGLRFALSKNFDFFLLLNPDTIMDSNLLNSFLYAAEKKPDGGIFGAKIFRYDRMEVIDHFGGLWDPKIAEFQSHGQGKKDIMDFCEMVEVDYVSGCAFFIRRKVIDRIGLFDPRFFLIWEETDYCARAKKAGFEIWAVPNAKVWHKISTSFVGGKPHLQYYWWRNRLLWIDRNISKQEKKKLYSSVLFPEIFHLTKLFFLKRMEYFFLSLFFSKKTKQRKKEKLLRYKASFFGIFDFFLKRFGIGPAWIAKKR